MKRESSWGMAGFFAIAATVGIAVQPWNQGTASPGEATNNPYVRTPEPAAKSTGLSDACSGLARLLANFLAIENSSVGGPDYCYPTKPPGSSKPHLSPTLDVKLTGTKFVLATVPDPVHTHLSLIFDRFTEAIQQAAQDEHYYFESSWMPWEDDKQPYALLPDQDAADHRKSERENQPGIILFRRSIMDSNVRSANSDGPPEALAVFIVGEEATAGIHREQFRNASAWVEYLSGADNNRTLPIGILGPSFSGSFSSLDQLLSDSSVWNRLQPQFKPQVPHLAIYSGSANGGKIINAFVKAHENSITFHSFLQDDDVILNSFMEYIEKNSPGDSISRVALLSEEDTAFGNLKPDEDDVSSRNRSNDIPLRLTYSRDISSLRSAYQSKSIFGIASSQSQSETHGKNLPTDLADSASKTHDTVRSYAGNQIPLSQEAHLLSIVNSLSEFRIRYLILRGTNSLDILFLANFFRRALPDTRLVIDSPDTLFQRERGATSLRGTMTLATYPLFVQEQDWTGNPAMHARRYFKSEVSEGVYIALRLLLNSKSLLPDSEGAPGCSVTNDSSVFLPSVQCGKGTSLPDYTPPLWFGSRCNSGSVASCYYPGPVSWLSVIGHNTFWPLATLTPNADAMAYLPNAAAWQRPDVPVSIKLGLIFVLLLGLFHCWSCHSASVTAKPAFLSHYARIGHSNHDLLIAIGCFSIAAMSMLIGWGSGIFLDANRPVEARWPIAILVSAIWTSAASAYLGHYKRNSTLAGVSASRRTTSSLMKRFVYFLLMTAAFLLAFTVYLESHLLPQNSLLTHWRAMHLGSGISPLVPVLLIAAGIYVWFWFSLHGLALFGKERCLLPRCEDLTVKGPAGENIDVLRVFSREDNAIKLECLAKPLSREVGIAMACLTLLFFTASYFMEGAFPLRSLGVTGYSAIVDILLCACLGLMFAETWQLYRVWGKLHRLLAFLDYIPLRRTLAALHGFSWGRVWKMSGNVLDVRYKLLSRQVESRNHLATSLREKIAVTGIELPEKWIACTDVLRRCDAFLSSAHPTDGGSPMSISHEVGLMPSTEHPPMEEWIRMFSSQDLKGKTSAISAVIEAGEKYFAQLPSKDSDVVAIDLRPSLISTMEPLREFLALADAMHAIEALQKNSMALAKWYADSYGNPEAGSLKPFTRYQMNSAKAAGVVLSRVLVPHWRKEGKSLVIVPHDHGKNEDDRNLASPSLAEELYIRNAEEFVSFPFLGFVQNILGRMRTIVMGILALFIAVTLSVSSYPFDPRHAISIVLVAAFVILGGVITYVYADMHRDSTLSHLTNTTPGELGSDFWFKILGFGIGPLIGLMATIFPEIGDFVLSWLQPGINSVK